MRHSIDSIIAACDKSIAEAEAAEAKAYEARVAAYQSEVKLIKARRRTAARTFAAIAATLDEGKSLTKQQETFLKNLGYYRHKLTGVVVRDLTGDALPEPKRNAKPASGYVYQLRQAMLDLRRDNEGQTTVSTSFLKDLGFGTHVIRWLVRASS